MRILFITILAFWLFESPYCSIGPFIPTDAYPENVGNFKRETVANERVKTISTRYVNQTRPKQHSIGLELDLLKYLDSSLAKCSPNYFAKSNTKLLKDSELKDKSGKQVGVIRICKDNEQEAENFYIEMTNGDVSFFIRTNNLKGEVEKNEPLSLNEIVEFAKEIPFNSNLDFENLP